MLYKSLCLLAIAGIALVSGYPASSDKNTLPACTAVQFNSAVTACSGTGAQSTFDYTTNYDNWLDENMCMCTDAVAINRGCVCNVLLKNSKCHLQWSQINAAYTNEALIITDYNQCAARGQVDNPLGCHQRGDNTDNALNLDSACWIGSPSGRSVAAFAVVALGAVVALLV